MSKRTDQGEREWLARVDALLGGAPEGHPSSARLSAHAAGELAAGERATIAAHLNECAPCRELHAAARAGLDEAERIEQGLALDAALRSTAAPPRAVDSGALHLPFFIPAAPAPRALAASAALEAAPEAADRRVLLEEAGLYRLVYFREGAAARLGLFAERLAELTLELRLDGAPLAPRLTEPEALVFELGPATLLAGKTLELRLRRGEVGLAERSIVFVEEER